MTSWTVEDTQRMPRVKAVTATKPTIAYVTQFFPYLTETFVYREVLALREHGFDVVTLANRTPDDKHLSAESLPLMASTSYVFPLQWVPFLFAHLYFMLRHPLRYFGTLINMMTQRGESWDNRKRTFGHFMGGVFLARKAQKQHVSHIHAHFSVNAATIGLAIARLLDIGYSFTVHNNIFTDQLILKEKLKSADFIISISEYSRNFLLNFAPDIPNLRDKFRIVHCGISPKSFVPDRPKIASETPHIVYLSSLAERKGMPMLVEACRILRDRGRHFHCTIAGGGEQWFLLQDMVAKYNLQDRVSTPGRYLQEEIRDYLNEADVFVLPCITAKNGDIDGIPVALMEAMAMQVPVISTTVSGVPELIEDGVSGLLVEERNPEQLANAIERIFDDHDFAVTLGENGRDKVSQAFNLDLISHQLVDLFDSFLN